MILARQTGGVTRFHIGQAFAPAAIGIQASKPNREAHSRCLQACAEIHFETLDGRVRCDDFCDCLYLTDNSVWRCLWQMIEDAAAATLSPASGPGTTVGLSPIAAPAYSRCR
jgi:hypothetical protein